MSDIGFMIGKTSEIPSTKTKLPSRFDPLNDQIYKYFDLLKADETINLPVSNMEKKRRQNKATQLRTSLTKKYPRKIVGCSVTDEFIYIFCRGLRDEVNGAVKA